MQYRGYQFYEELDEKNCERFGIANDLTEAEWKAKQEELSKDIDVAIDIEGTPIFFGDVLEYEDGRHEYVFRTDDGRYGENACSLSWIGRELKQYGEEVYVLTAQSGFLGALVIGHHGDGSFVDGNNWFDHDLYWQYRLGNYEA